MKLFKKNEAGFEEKFEDFLRQKRENAVDVNDAVRDILQNVRQNGDKAVFAYTKKFDRFDVDEKSVRFSPDEIAAAVSSCPQKTLDAMRFAAERIRRFHEKQYPENVSFTDGAGVFCGWRYTPVSAAGLYVPGGTAAYPSSVLMNAIPARVAGVKRLVMVVPTPEGKVNPLVLAAANAAGIDEIYRIGGAQAVGALAYGTQTIAPVDVVVGPGNAFVAAAKRQVFGTVGIDMIAGPSEILVVADKTANPEWLAADLLSQAEHDVSAQAILITDSDELARKVCACVDRQIETLARREIAEKSWRDNGAVFLVGDVRADAPALADKIAPEHLELCVENPQALCDEIHHAGAFFLGAFTPEAVGDYVGGPNHVLPTARSARFSSGLGVLSFMKRSTLLSCNADAVRAVGPHAVVLAETEGLTAHAASVQCRLK